MWFLKLQDLLARLSEFSSYLPALLIALGLAIFLGCAVGCCSAPCKEKDDLFHREVY